MLVKATECTGCGGCAAACPKQCITMKIDAEGFRYPIINQESCIQCKICEKTCSVLHVNEVSSCTEAFAVHNKDNEVRRESSSGGVFSELAKYVIEKRGYVCGAIYDENFEVRHTISNSIDQLAFLRGAKYAQSIAEPCYKTIKNLLIKGNPVLFVGTPCQVAGLQRYLKRDYSNLILVDMICHGVPSPLIWKMYLKERRRKDAGGALINSVNLRSKISGWSKYSYSVVIRYENGVSYTEKQSNDIFMQGFVNNLYIRPSCEKCKFKGIERSSDFTLGDYWGIWDQYPEFDDNHGTSLVFIHSEKGYNLWKEIRDRFKYLRIDSEQAVAMNKSMLEGSVPHSRREEFFEYISSCNDLCELISRMLSSQHLEKGSILRKLLNRFIKCFIRLLK
ncbi:Coenzyme F420 hydrogenase/dehydrogenase, beta subunit C-terminal domain [Alloiococcus sp. CFN-8]|uniref:Coenzyme F420 hydrogenase/dehydrogenase, beta subunit C-terminal domain n=1 Tax=Alloiococcus sp. CFN-8 TaxID=3416081 RepID=UPI003CEE7DFB